MPGIRWELLLKVSHVVAVRWRLGLEPSQCVEPGLERQPAGGRSTWGSWAICLSLSVVSARGLRVAPVSYVVAEGFLNKCLKRNWKELPPRCFLKVVTKIYPDPRGGNRLLAERVSGNMRTCQYMPFVPRPLVDA